MHTCSQALSLNRRHGQWLDGVLIVYELGYNTKWHLKLTVLMEIGMEFHVAGEL